MSEKKVTPRGFRIYDDTIKARHGTIRVQESSLAFEGAHAWLFYDEDGADKGAVLHPHAQINVEAAKKLIAALQSFVEEAEGDQLTEPAVS
jgi:hypothetical protein